MRLKLLDVLACPSCGGSFAVASVARRDEDEILDGSLACAGCGHTAPVTDGIPRFVSSDLYASSFGLQWNLFRVEQIDSVNRTGLSERRFFSETGWAPDWMRGKWILDAGCGAGRFLEVASRYGCDVVGVDLSHATDAARTTLRQRPNVHLVQASVDALPFKPGAFDGCYCIGVIQHTPTPQRALEALPRVVTSGGRVAVTIYERRRWTMLNGKYLARRVTRRMNPRLLLLGVRALMPLLFPITDVLFRLPVVGRAFMFVIPVANYVHETRLTRRERYRWAVLDTFDMLAPAYDQPQTEAAATAALERGGLSAISRQPMPGLTLVGVRP